MTTILVAHMSRSWIKPMDRHFLTSRATVVSYPAYCGGKFLINCLALSKWACPQDPIAAQYLVDRPNDYDYRLDTVLRTLPHQDRMKDWQSFEFGDQQLYGYQTVKMWQQGQAIELNDITMKICDANLQFFLVDNTLEPLGLLKIWKSAKIVRLINAKQFQRISLEKKTNNTDIDPKKYNGNYCEEFYDKLKGPDWPAWSEFEKYGYDIRKISDVDTGIMEEIGAFYRVHLIENQVSLFDVDQCYLDKKQFMKALQQLYSFFGFDDFNYELIERFYDRYIELHI
jgi:hypothetical protein